MTEICILSLYPWFQGMQAHLCSRTCVLETVAIPSRGGGGGGWSREEAEVANWSG